MANSYAMATVSAGIRARTGPGSFQSDRLGRLEVGQARDGLQARLGAMQLSVIAASPGLFGASKSGLDAPEPFRYDETANSLRWNDDTFVRMGQPRSAGD
jgi:hypothetical protein